MMYSYKINKKTNAIIVAVIGEMHPAEFAKLNVEICTLALKLNYKIIFNFKDVIVRIGFGEMYFWFSNHLDKVNSKFRYIPTAHIANENNERFFNFVEIAWSNQGARIKMFKKDTEAVGWLSQF